MKPEDFRQKAKELVAQYENAKLDKQSVSKKAWERGKMTADDVYIVWWSKTLQNAKMLLSTDRRTGMYYECTLDGEKGFIYFDAYKKQHNVAVDIKGGESK